MKRYLKQVYGYIFNTVNGDVTLAEDLTQETFLRVYRALDKFDQNRLFKPWLFTIATNVCKTALKKQQHQPILLSESAQAMNFLDNIADDKSGIEPIPDTHVAEGIQTALGKLSPNIRQALILRHVYDLSYEQVASVMQANTNTVRTWLKRGRESLKNRFEQWGGLLDG
jgi:RNA polymerase sigma-70 factor (ECF subfamily)